jgi:hypothetical protein
MKRLIPETRVNKNGIPVIKHVRAEQPSKSSRLLSRIIPAISPSHRAATIERRAEIMEFFKGELEKDKNEKIRLEEIAIQQETDPATKRLLVQASTRRSYNNFLRSSVDTSALEKISSYSLDTLERLMEASGESKNATSLVNVSVLGEKNFRAYLNFMNCDIDSSHIGLILDNVRDSTGLDDLAELELGSEAHNLASTVIKVASESHSRRSKAHYARQSDEDDSGIYRRTMRHASLEWYREQQTLTKMTRDLAAVIVDNPDRVDDILDYMSDRDIIPEDVDSGHLRLHLSNASSSLSSGIL